MPKLVSPHPICDVTTVTNTAGVKHPYPKKTAPMRITLPILLVLASSLGLAAAETTNGQDDQRARKNLYRWVFDNPDGPRPQMRDRQVDLTQETIQPIHKAAKQTSANNHQPRLLVVDSESLTPLIKHPGSLESSPDTPASLPDAGNETGGQSGQLAPISAIANDQPLPSGKTTENRLSVAEINQDDIAPSTPIRQAAAYKWSPRRPTRVSKSEHEPPKSVEILPEPEISDPPELPNPEELLPELNAQDDTFSQGDTFIIDESDVEIIDETDVEIHGEVHGEILTTIDPELEFSESFYNGMYEFQGTFPGHHLYDHYVHPWVQRLTRNSESFYVSGEALLWFRDNASINQIVVIDEDITDADYPVLGTGNLAFRVEPGMRVQVGSNMNACSKCTAWEFDYFGIFDWDATATVQGDNELGIFGDLGLLVNNFTGADEVRLDYSTRLHNIEMNCVKHWGQNCCESLDLLTGFRFAWLGEEFNINSMDDDQGATDYNIATENHLYGYQIGARVKGERPRLGWEATGKAGIFGNHAEHDQLISTDFPPPTFPRPRQSKSGGSLAFIGELSAKMVYRICQDWSLRGGYSVLWIEGVALAPDQLDFTFTPTSGHGLNTNAGLLVHGANVGIEARW